MPSGGAGAHPLGTVAEMVSDTRATSTNGVKVQIAPYGRGARAALDHAVTSAKGADPFAPVTVVVERRSLALSVRRQLADRPGGVVNVRLLTWAGLGVQLTEGWLAAEDRPLVSSPAVLEAVRATVEQGRAGRFFGARDVPATLRALARTAEELMDVDPRTLRQLGATGSQAADVVAVVGSARRALASGVTTNEMLSAATERVRREPGDVAAQLGPVVVYLARRIGPAELALLDALGAILEVTVIVGSTGQEGADASNDALVHAITSLAHATSAPAGAGRPDPPASSDRRVGDTLTRHGAPSTIVRSAPSADAEVLVALGDLTTLNAAGTRLDRMALLYGGLDPYPRLVHDALVLAGVPFHGAATRTLAASAPGRVLTGVLSLGDHDWQRDDVSAWLGSGPLLFAGKVVPSAQWDLDAREAGVVKGLDEWDQRLEALGSTRRSRAWRAAQREGAAVAETGARQSCEELRAFVAQVAERLDHVAASWAEWASWASALLVWLLGGADDRALWPDEERAAFDAITDALHELGSLDWVGGRAPALSDVRTAVDAALEAPAPRTARFGHGVFAGRLSEAVGLDFDAVVVVGVADGMLFDPGTDDVLLPDAQRAACGVPLRMSRHGDTVHDLLAVLEAAPARVISYPRFDQRRGSVVRPAPVVLDVLEAAAGLERRLLASELAWGAPEDLPRGVFDFTSSYPDAVRGRAALALPHAGPHPCSGPASPSEWRLRSLLPHARDRATFAAHALARSDPVIRRGLAARFDRRRPGFTRFDGAVADGGAVEVGERTVSSLEAYTRCPRSFFFEQVLGVRAREAPEVALEMDAATRGMLVHKVLERFVAEELSGAADGDPLERVRSCAARVFEEAERAGLTGMAVLWHVERRRIERRLEAHVAEDARYRAAESAKPVAAEASFGAAVGSEVAASVGRASSIGLRGRIDRIDVGADGTLFVIDYKTGAKAPPKVTQDDPLAHGSRFQLAAYGVAAEALYPGSPTQAAYWFLGSALDTWLQVDDSVKAVFSATLEQVSGWIAGGLFPARPGSPDVHAPRGAHCVTCPYDSVCPADRVAQWARVHDDPVLAPYVSLVEPPEERGAPKGKEASS